MNIFRFLGDLSHLASIFILLHKIQTTRSCRGISFKSQFLYLIVFLTRYVDLFTSYVSLYNTLMKLFFIGATAYTLYLMRVKYRPTQDAALDTFKLTYLIPPVAILALLFNYQYTPFEITWAFSIWLESVAILPQLFMLQRTGEAETITTHYLAALALYRGLYIPNWMYRYFTDGAFDPIAVCAGLIQTAIYADFGYIYVTKVLRGQKFELPA
ncbi:hypothetical protein CI109_101527 [Kwoniella shandongensis]|uniref:ER lumen protein-retaining receptor n=1 Tax=Kwoniella shandongensis TaxID=1734106 RepID=A0A5M6C5X3_9TREE|nr:uncharacterized protein CI109_001341 [Kwoniella shandongensis]KAA5530537.1 hypothetical protein CI109_001341 [Kwoniella shandongensis]